MDQTIPQPSHGTYQPVGVPVPLPTMAQKHPGLTQGIVGILCAVIALVLLPPVCGIAGIVFGVIAIRKGEKAVGVTAIVLSAIFMLFGMGLSYYAHMHPEIFQTNTTATTGAVIEAFMQQ